jgi:hypothetical protein
MGERLRRDSARTGDQQADPAPAARTAGPISAANPAALLALQRSAGNAATLAHLRRKETGENAAGLPDQLRSGIENLSGTDLSDVRVHYNSPNPAALQAGAFAQGSDIHVAPGQERHLPHEAWHVVQQRGGVVPAGAMTGTPVNDDESLEHEADEMGDRARRKPR